jgi:two-component system, OmpR family, phosphate regulon sensor histidine kinase PhoR
MRKFIFRISIILIIIISLPVSFLIIRQLSDLTENEKIVTGVFEKQIETILYSLNQTSDNIIKSWINQIDLPTEYNSEIHDKIVNSIFENNQAIYKIEFVDLNRNKTLFKKQRTDSIQYLTQMPDGTIIEELKRLFADGYQRIESKSNGEFTNLYFLFKNREKDVLGVFYINTKTFIEQNLGPNIQQVAQQSFIIKVTSIKDNKILYSVGPIDEKLLDSQSRIAWYLPGIEFSIQLRSVTINSLVRERSLRENYIFAGVLLIVLLGILFVILSIRKEIFLSEMKSEFVSNVSHEIRTPLALISLYAETLLLKRFKTKEKESEYLSVIQLEAQRLSEMVNRILTFSKMEKKKRIYNQTEIELNSLIEEVIYSYSPHLREMNVAYKLDFESEKLTILADKEATVECLINLLDNAVKYGRENGKMIAIRTFQNQGRIQLDIEDNGIGISKKHQRHIFEKFYRVTKGNLAYKTKGTGLGLNIVKQIMEHNGGRVKVKSTLGKGSCFSLIFPHKKLING